MINYDILYKYFLSQSEDAGHSAFSRAGFNLLLQDPELKGHSDFLMLYAIIHQSSLRSDSNFKTPESFRAFLQNQVAHFSHTKLAHRADLRAQYETIAQAAIQLEDLKYALDAKKETPTSSSNALANIGMQLAKIAIPYARNNLDRQRDETIQKIKEQQDVTIKERFNELRAHLTIETNAAGKIDTHNIEEVLKLLRDVYQDVTPGNFESKRTSEGSFISYVTLLIANTISKKRGISNPFGDINDARADDINNVRAVKSMADQYRQSDTKNSVPIRKMPTSTRKERNEKLKAEIFAESQRVLNDAEARLLSQDTDYRQLYERFQETGIWSRNFIKPTTHKSPLILLRNMGNLTEEEAKAIMKKGIYARRFGTTLTGGEAVSAFAMSIIGKEKLPSGLLTNLRDKLLPNSVITLEDRRFLEDEIGQNWRTTIGENPNIMSRHIVQIGKAPTATGYEDHPGFTEGMSSWTTDQEVAEEFSKHFPNGYVFVGMTKKTYPSSAVATVSLEAEHSVLVMENVLCCYHPSARDHIIVNEDRQSEFDELQAFLVANKNPVAGTFTSSSGYEMAFNSTLRSIIVTHTKAPRDEREFQGGSGSEIGKETYHGFAERLEEIKTERDVKYAQASERASERLRLENLRPHDGRSDSLKRN